LDSRPSTLLHLTFSLSHFLTHKRTYAHTHIFSSLLSSSLLQLTGIVVLVSHSSRTFFPPPSSTSVANQRRFYLCSQPAQTSISQFVPSHQRHPSCVVVPVESDRIPPLLQKTFRSRIPTNSPRQTNLEPLLDLFGVFNIERSIRRTVSPSIHLFCASQSQWEASCSNGTLSLNLSLSLSLGGSRWQATKTPYRHRPPRDIAEASSAQQKRKRRIALATMSRALSSRRQGSIANMTI